MPVAWLTSARDSALSSAQALLPGSLAAACMSTSSRSSSGTPANSAATAAPPQLRRGQVAGFGPEQIERADILAGHHDGHGADAADPHIKHRGPVDRPAPLCGVAEILHQHRGPFGHRVQARPLPEGELQLVVLRARVPLDPSVPVLTPSNTNEIAAASTSRSVTHASHSRSAASTPRQPLTASSNCSAIDAFNANAPGPNPRPNRRRTSHMLGPFLSECPTGAAGAASGQCRTQAGHRIVSGIEFSACRTVHCQFLRRGAAEFGVVLDGVRDQLDAPVVGSPE